MGPVRPVRSVLGGVAVVISVLIAQPAAGQAPTGSQTQTPSTPVPLTQTRPAAPDVRPGALPPSDIPGVLLPPRIGPDFLYAPPVRGPLTVTPSLAITEQYNDNIFTSNANKQSDFITQFTPSLALQIQHPGFQWLSAFSFTAEIYADHSELNSAANSLSFLTSASYQATQRVNLSLTEALNYGRNGTNLATSGVSSGRQESWSNVLSAGLGIQLTPRTTWNLSGAYSLERFAFFRRPRRKLRTNGLNVTAGYDFAYLDIDREPTTFTHTPRIGGSYQLTQTLSATATAGPSFVVTDRDTTITPSGNVSVVKAMSWGSMSAFYDASVGTTAGSGGPSDNQTFGGNISVGALLRGLVIDFSPSYSRSGTLSSSRSNADVDTLTLNLSARYQIFRNISVIGSYTFLRQRASGSSTNTGSNAGTNDVDQNIITLGLQFSHPINFD